MKTRGAIPIILVIVLAVAGTTQLVPNWRVWNWSVWHKHVPIEQLQAAQADLAKAQADAQAKQLALQQALDKQKADTTAQVGYAQQMNAGIPVALKNAPQTPEVKLAASLSDRVASGLSSAIGELPQAKQAEIEDIVNQALSAKQAEVDAANAALAKKDAELSIVTTEKTQLAAQIPVLKADADKAAATFTTTQAKVTDLTGQVVTYAQKAQQAAKESGSLGALAHNLILTLILVAIGYIFFHYVLPSLVAEFPASKLLTVPYRWATSILSAHTVTIPQPPEKSP